MKYKSVFHFVWRETVAVAFSAAFAILMLNLIMGDSTFYNRIIGGLYLGSVAAAFSPLFTLLPILGGAMVLRQIARRKREGFEKWSAFTGVWVAAIIYGLLLRRQWLDGLQQMDRASTLFAILLMAPSIWAWQRLARKYLRD